MLWFDHHVCGRNRAYTVLDFTVYVVEVKQKFSGSNSFDRKEC